MAFLKGKLKKDETIFEGGYRELLEETGIEKDDFDIHIEMSNKDNPATSYFVGEYKHKINPTRGTFVGSMGSLWWYNKLGGRINILTSLVDRLLKLC